MDTLKKIIAIVLICLLSGGTVYAYTAEVSYFFEGIDINTGEVFRDPLVLIIVGGSDPTAIEQILRPPPGFFPEFGENPVDLYPIFDPAAGTSLVFLPVTPEDLDDPDQIVGLIIDGQTIELPTDEYFTVPIGESAIVTFLTNSDIMFISTITPIVRGDLWGIGMDNQVVPEPATMLLFGVGLLGLFGLRRRRKSRKHGRTHKLLVTLVVGAGIGLLGGALPAAAQSFSCADVTEIPQTECEALVALYNSTDGNNWTQNSGWLDTTTPCSWFGVTCDSGYVTQLNLVSNLLKGNIPSELGNLTNLQELLLGYNQLGGNIPPELGNLTNLQYLFLEFSQLNGNIPRELGNLTNLQHLRLGFNQLSGNIPPELGNLSNLTTLQLLYNQLSGNIPPELGNLVKLVNLSLDNNYLSGSIPPELGNLTNLQGLWLWGNHLSGYIPPELGDLTNLQDLNLEINGLRGNIPTSLSSLNELLRLNLRGNQLTGPVPKALTNLTKLELFYFHENNLCEPADTTFQNWLSSIPSLRRTGVTCTPSICDTVTEIPYAECDTLVILFESTDGDNWDNNTGWMNTDTPCSWYGVTCLEGHVTGLDLHNNQLSGEIPAELQTLSNLETLFLNDNSLTGSLPTQLVSLTELQSLGFSNTELCESQDTTFQEWLDSIPALQRSGKMCEVYLCDAVTEIPQTECEALVTLYNSTNGNYWSDNQHWLKTDTPCNWYGVTCSGGHITRLDLHINRLKGNIPEELSNLVNLQHLALWGNYLSGSIPSELGNLLNLQYLSLDWNYLSGSIPPELGNLTNLQYLYLWSNHLSGSIPPELGNLTNLKDFYLAQNSLSGSIPSELGNLTNLRHFVFWVNQLNGSIPSELGNLINLQRLVLQFNQLSGNIPAELGKLTGLQTLGLHANQLSGDIPPELGKLTNLPGLYLYGNQLSGSIPSELGNLTNLRTLWLTGNQLSGSIPSEIGNLANLQSLYLDYNQLSGSLPATLTNLTALLWFRFDHTNLCEPQDTAFQTWLASISDVRSNGLTCLSGVCDTVTEIPQAECEALVALYNSTSGDNWTNNSGWGQTDTPCSWFGVSCDGGHVAKVSLFENNLSGNIPSELESLANLESLLLGKNFLSGNIPAELGNLTNLQGLHLRDNKLSGNIPVEIWNLTNLRTLDLHTNQLSGNIHPEVGNLINLERLYLYANQLSGSIPSEISNLANLQYLQLNNNQLNGDIPPELGDLVNLQNLRLYSNQLNGTIPPELGNLVNLQYLGLSNNQLNGSIPAELGNLITLEFLSLANNQLNGSIPPELGNLTNLQNLSLHDNQLNGTIPSELSNLTNLERLGLDGNQLTGSIPPELGNLVNLEYLYLYQNQLSGSIPPEFGNLAKLHVLSLNENQLSGNIPPELGALINLGYLGLYKNSLCGNIPPEIGNLPKLKELTLYDNSFSGSLPANLTNLTDLQKFYFNNTNLCEPQDTDFQTWLASIPDVLGTGACVFYDYFVFDEYGGAWHDVNKTGDDDQMCWGFTVANILAWTGWEAPDLFETEVEIFAHIKDYWTNAASLMKYSWRWWVDGNAPPEFGAGWSTLKDTGGGNHWPEHSFFNAYSFHWKRSVMAAVKDYLRSGYGVGIAIYDSEDSQDAGHALTVWGYRYYDDGTVTGLWVTDSDDGVSELRYLPVTYQSNWIGGNLYGLKWRIAEASYAYQGWLIEGVQAFKPREPRFVRVRKAGSGQGRVVSDPVGINCGETCVKPFPENTDVILTASPADGSTFLGWAGECNGMGDCVVTVDGERQIIALFEAPPGSESVTISVEDVPGVMIYPPDGEDVPAGTDPTFVFVPDAGQRILDVLIDGYSMGALTWYTFTDALFDHTIEVKTIAQDANFAAAWKKCIEVDENGDIVYEDGQPKQIACEPGKNATIIAGDQVCDSECMQFVISFEQGTAFPVKVILDPGASFLGWELNGEMTDPETFSQIIYTLEDTLVRPVIGRCHN